MTPAGHPILGPVPGLDGFHVASGCYVGGLSLSRAAGRALADLVLDGKCEPDLSPFAIVRFQGWTERPDLDAVCMDRYVRPYMH